MNKASWFTAVVGAVFFPTAGVVGIAGGVYGFIQVNNRQGWDSVFAAIGALAFLFFGLLAVYVTVRAYRIYFVSQEWNARDVARDV